MATIEFRYNDSNNKVNSWPDDKPLLPVETRVYYNGVEFKVVGIMVIYYKDDFPQIHMLCDETRD